MKAQTVKLAPKPAQLAADRRRRAVAEARVKVALAGLFDGLDPETRVEACRSGIRALAQAAALNAGPGRAAGVLCGALADIAPAYRTEKPAVIAAEALFVKGER